MFNFLTILTSFLTLDIAIWFFGSVMLYGAFLLTWKLIKGGFDYDYM